MPVLANPRHERFARALARGVSATEAYVEAGFKPNSGNATTLKSDQRISKRVQALLDEAEFVEKQALKITIEKLAITKERVIRELAAIGFADIRKVLSWRGESVTEKDNPDGGEVLVIKEIVTNTVRLNSSDEIDDDTAAAIAEVKQTATGLSIKMHNKHAALQDLAKHFGLLVEKMEHSGTMALIVETGVPRE